ncbi:MAG: sialidase family protein [bacterium]
MNFQIKRSSPFILAVLICFGLLSMQQKESLVYSDKIQHGIVFYEDGRFGGWPANHGIWSWGNEILVGFIEAEYRETRGLHTYDPTTARSKYARSKDGGVTWTIEDAFRNGQTARGADHNIPADKAKKPMKLTESIPDFTNPDFIFTFLRHNNNNGPSHFYYSKNRGEQWIGPFKFPNLGTTGVASRTDYIVEGKQELGAFLTISKRNSKEGNVIYVKTEDGGLSWNLKSWIGPEHGGFDIMPSSLRLSPSELLTTIRTRTESGLDLITSYYSNNNGETWERLKDPVADTGRGGSPPAIIKLKDGRLALGYIYRSEFGSRVNIRFSSDNGKTWSDEIMLRGGDGANRDTGYPRMVQRPDGKIVMIYYWNNALQKNKKPYRYIAYTILDPDLWK